MLMDWIGLVTLVQNTLPEEEQIYFLLEEVNKLASKDSRSS